MSSATHDKENKVAKAFGIFGDIFALNVIFILFSIPIITIGASLTALYSMMLKLTENREGTIWNGFVTAFKSNFKQATKAWLLVLLASVIIAGEIIFIIRFGGAIATFYSILVVLEILALLLVLAFLFPLIARYENSLMNTMKNAFLLSLSNLWPAIQIILGWVMPAFLSFYEPMVFMYTWYLWLLLAFGIITFCTSFPIKKVFKKIEAVQEANEKKRQEELEKQKAIEKKHGDVKKYHRSHRELMKQLAEENKEINETSEDQDVTNEEHSETKMENSNTNDSSTRNKS